MKKCPFINEHCQKEECEFYNERKNICNLLLFHHKNYKSLKRQNSFLKVLSLLLVGCIVIGGVVYTPPQKENTPNVSENNPTNHPPSTEEQDTNFPYTVNEEATLTIGNDYHSSTADNASYASIQPYGITISSDITIQAINGFAFKIYALSDISTPTNSTPLTPNWTTAYTFTEKSNLRYHHSKTRR